MHFHFPKPLHGWREFAGEVGIIVVGVLIALGAEQLVETWHHHQQAEQATRAIAEELENAAAVGYERLIIQPCLQGRIRELQTQLVGASGPWKGSPMVVGSKGYQNVVPVAYRGPSRPLPTDSWKAATTSGTIDFMDPAKARAFSAIYDQIALFDAAQAEEARAAARLSPLAFDRTLDENARTEMLADLADVDRINSLMALVAQQMIEEVRSEKLDMPRSEVAGDRATLIDTQRAARGTCVRSDLPLELN